MKNEKRIVVAINLKSGYCNIDEALSIIYQYTDCTELKTHNLDESKNYIDLRPLTNDEWESFTNDYCSGKETTDSGLYFEKYDDWRLCCLPIGWDDQ